MAETGIAGDGSDEYKFKCKLCSTLFKTESELQEHEKSSNYHKRMALRTEQTQKGLTVHTVVTTVPVHSDQAELNVWLPVIEHKLAGMQHIVEVQRSKAQQLTYYVCELCAMSQMPVIEHVVSRAHKLEFLFMHFAENEDEVLKLELNDDEKNYVQKSFKDRHYIPGAHGNLKSQDITTLINRLVDAIISHTGQQDIKVVKETTESKHLPGKQPPLTRQIKGHKDDAYPEHLKKKLKNTEDNFSKSKQRSQSQGRSSGKSRQPAYQGGVKSRDSLLGSTPRYLIGGRGGGYAQSAYAQAANMGYGYQPHGLAHQSRQLTRGPQGANGYFDYGSHGDFDYGQGSDKKQRLTLLDWLHQTVAKLDRDTLCVSEESELAKQVVCLLRVGIDMFHDKGGYDDFCVYPQPVDARMVTLMEWLRMTVKFFDSAWLCSPREVTIAQVVISQLEMAIDKFRMRSLSAAGPGRRAPPLLGDRPRTGGYGMAMSSTHHYDPYAEQSRSVEAYDLNAGFSSLSLGGGGYGAGRGAAAAAAAQQALDRHINPKTGKVYVRRQGRSHIVPNQM